MKLPVSTDAALLLALLLCPFGTSARTPLPPPSAEARLVYEEHVSTALIPAHLAAISKAIASIEQQCGAAWPTRGSLWVRVGLRPQSRQTFEVMWSRAERTREHFKSINIGDVMPINLTISESPPNDLTEGSGSDHVVVVRLQCDTGRRW